MNKLNSLLAAAAAGWLLTGCATARNEIVLDCVGPQPAAAASANSTSGTLLVFSAYRIGADFDSRDARRPEYSDYRILSADGRLFQTVHNNSGTILQDAVPVTLPPGQYRVRARANGYGYVIVPVVVEAGRKTVLHLDGDNKSDMAELNQANAVRLPDGQLVGARANAGGQ
jgi:hypothetical protein